jgi:hypothetical protein
MIVESFLFLTLLCVTVAQDTPFSGRLQEGSYKQIIDSAFIPKTRPSILTLPEVDLDDEPFNLNLIVNDKIEVQSESSRTFGLRGSTPSISIESRPVLVKPEPLHPVLSSTFSGYEIRVHAVLVSNDDGSGGAAGAQAVDAAFLQQVVEKTNEIYHDAGIQFVFDPNEDFEKVRSTILNTDFDMPVGLNLKLPEDTPPLSDEEIENLAESHKEARQQLGRQHRHKMLLLLTDGNMIQFNATGTNIWEVVIPRTYAFSWETLEFIALPTTKGNVQNWANLLGHESGHYFHQRHTHGWTPKTVEEAADLIRTKVGDGEVTEANALSIFDGDSSFVTDTPADSGGGIFRSVHGNECGPDDTVSIPVWFPASSHWKTYILQPDRGNVLSYFKHCTNIPMHFSSQQIEGILSSLEDGNRWHLVHPSMRLQTLETQQINGQTKYTAVWKPSEEDEIQVYGWKYQDYRNKYDELWPQGWRLHILETVVENSVPKYNAVWRRSTSDEIQVYRWSYQDFRNKYDQLWPQGWRLHILDTYVVSGATRYNAVWRPSTSGEIQVYGWKYQDFRNKYDQLWPLGWRLHILDTYVVNKEARYVAVWRPSTTSEIQVYGWSYQDYRDKYDDLWSQGWRLSILDTYVVNHTQLYNAVWRPGNEGEIQIYSASYDSYRDLYDRMW